MVTPFKLDFENIINSPACNEWEKNFAHNIYEYSKTKLLSQKQMDVWNRLVKKADDFENRKGL